MAITEQEMTHEQMKLHESKGFVCKVCGAPVLVVWGGSYNHNGYLLKCSKSLEHTGVARNFKLGVMDTPDGLNIGNMSRIRRRNLEKRIGEEKATALAKYSGAGYLTKEEATEIITTVWPDASKIEVLKASIVCAQYGLNPLMKHLYLIPFDKKKKNEKTGQWETVSTTYAMVLGIKASRIIARRRGEYAYLDDTPRIMTTEEQMKIFGEVDVADICAITRLQDRKGNTAIGTGRWPNSQTVQGADKGNNKLNMAMIRSERQALERLFPDSFPTEVKDVVDERFQEIGDGKQVDTNTGEIIETARPSLDPKNPPDIVEGELVEPAKTPETAPAATTATTATPEAVKDESVVTPEQLKEIAALLKEANVTEAELGKFCNKEQKWAIKKFADLKAWQYEEVKSYLNKAAGK